MSMAVECPCGVVVYRRPCLVRNCRAKYCSVACRAKYGTRRGDQHPAWKDEAVGYDALHDWVRRHRPKPELCEWCGEKSPFPLAWANLSHEYRRELSDWAALCTRCHKQYDKQHRYATNPTCGRGHLYDEQTTYFVNGNRRCKKCAAENARKYNQSRRDS